MKILRVGDPHAKVNNLDEMRKLISFVVEQAILHKVDRIEVLGDLFHTHAVLRLEVIDFWVWALDLLSNTCQTVVLVGNHDLSGDYNSNTSALTVFGLMGKKNLLIIEKPTLLGEIAYVPYIHDKNLFCSSAIALSAQGGKVLVCHQSIQGSKFESGMYDPDGIPTGEWSERFVHIVSGHIHSEQDFGNVIYPGTARWDTVTDANRRKGIWVYDHQDGTGTITSRVFITTEKVCSPIQSFRWAEGEAGIPEWPKDWRVAVELVGTSAWVSQKKAELKGKCSIKTKITDKQKIGETRQTGKNLEDFMRNLFVSTMDKDELIKYAREIGIV